MRAFGAPCGLRALSMVFAFNSSFILLPPSTLQPPLLAGPWHPWQAGARAHPPAVPLSHAALGAWLLHAPPRAVSVRGARRSLAFVGDFRAAGALYLPSGRALAWILTASRQRRLIFLLFLWSIFCPSALLLYGLSVAIRFISSMLSHCYAMVVLNTKNEKSKVFTRS